MNPIYKAILFGLLMAVVQIIASTIKKRSQS